MRRILTVSDRSFDVIVFMNADGSGEAVIRTPHSKLPTRILIAKPEAGERTVIMHNANGSTEVWYEAS